MKLFLSLRIFAVAIGLTLAMRVAEAKLTVGDPAPKFQVAKWVQGEPVKEFDTNHIYVVEFWATWCEPCRESIPHLNELWQKLKNEGVVIIGQDVWDSDNVVMPFMKKIGDQMTYRVALDDKSQETNGFMADNWLKAAEQNWIPAAFVINKQGRIAWIGDPRSLTEKLLQEILADKFDVAAFAKEYEKEPPEDEEHLIALNRGWKITDVQTEDRVWDVLDSNREPSEEDWRILVKAADKYTNGFDLDLIEMFGPHRDVWTSSN